MINTGEGPDFSDDTRLNETIDFYKRWNGAANGRITGAFALMLFIPALLPI